MNKITSCNNWFKISLDDRKSNVEKQGVGIDKGLISDNSLATETEVGFLQSYISIAIQII